MLWQDKTMDELLSEPLNRDLYKIYLELKEQEIDTGVTDEKIMNEVYYQCTKLVYENSAYPDFEAIDLDIKANVGTKLISRLVYRMMYAIFSVRINNSAEIEKIMKDLEVYSYVMTKNHFFRKFIKAGCNDRGKKFIELSPRPVPAKLLKIIPVYWPEITQEYDDQAIRMLIDLWEDPDDKLTVIENIEESFKLRKAGKDYKMLDYMRNTRRLCLYLDLKPLKREIRGMKGSSKMYAADIAEPVPDYEAMLAGKDEEIEQLKKTIASSRSTIEELKSRLNDFKSKQAQERSFSLSMILDYTENHTNEHTAPTLIAMLNYFLRNAGNCTKEEIEKVDGMERKMLYPHRGDQVQGNKNSFTDSAQLVSLTLPANMSKEELIASFPIIVEQLKKTRNG